jgi:hypothetical protein
MGGRPPVAIRLRSQDAERNENRERRPLLADRCPPYESEGMSPDRALTRRTGSPTLRARVLPHRYALMLSALVVVAVSAASPALATYPKPVRACGSLVAGARVVAVDIDEVGGGFSLTCPVAQQVMRRYLAIARQHAWPGGAWSFRRIKLQSLGFDCYKSRPDGVGWDYHCNATSPSGRGFADVGAGRRGKLCPRHDPRFCPPN